MTALASGPCPGGMIVAGEFWPGATGRALAAGLRRQGWMVGEVDLQHFLVAGGSLAARLLHRAAMRLSVRAYNAAILDAVRRSGARVFLALKGGLIAAETLDALRAMGCLTVNFYPDVEFEHAGFNRDLIAHYDLVITTKRFHRDWLDGAVGPARHCFVPHGFDPDLHRDRSPASEADYRTDICFIGTYSDYKRDFLMPLAGRPRFAIWGGGWNKGAAGTPLAAHVQPGAIIGDFYADAIGHSRISIALHHGPVHTPGWEDEVSTRSFEIPACGGFMLHIDKPELHEFYRVGEEVAVFSDHASLLAEVDRYLADPERRRAIARAGHARAVPAYSVDQRAALVSAEIMARITAAT